MARRPSVAIVGFGRAGGSIGIALEGAGWPVAAVWSRSAAARRRAARSLAAPVTRTAAGAAAAAPIVVVAVPDDAIADVAREIAPALRPRAVALHTSGATSVGALAPTGARIGSLHPLQTLPDPRRGAAALRGAPVAVTCEPAERALLHRLARAWGGRPFDLADADKPLYHAAAVFASNYVVADMWAGAELLRDAGVDPGVLAPLLRATVDNVVELGPARAITGPAARGDAGTIRRHLAAIPRGPVREAYRAMASLTSALVRP